MIDIFLDLKQELKVIEKIPVPKKEDGPPEVCNGHTTARTQVEIETQTSILTPQKSELFLFINCFC